MGVTEEGVGRMLEKGGWAGGWGKRKDLREGCWGEVSREGGRGRTRKVGWGEGGREGGRKAEGGGGGGGGRGG